MDDKRFVVFQGQERERDAAEDMPIPAGKDPVNDNTYSFENPFPNRGP